MYKVCLVFSLCLVAVFGDDHELVFGSFGDPVIQPAVTASCDVLDRAGLTCTTCDTLSRCVMMNNEWQTYEVDKCDTAEGTYCNLIEGRCSNSTGACNQPDFRCNEEGYFPNPYTCQEYVFCLPGNPIVSLSRVCDPGTAYSVLTNQCTLTIRDDVCSSLQWNCSAPGDIAGWPGSDELFYICQRDIVREELIPDLHRCLNYQIFDGQNCVNRP